MGSAFGIFTLRIDLICSTKATNIPEVWIGDQYLSVGRVAPLDSPSGLRCRLRRLVDRWRSGRRRFQFNFPGPRSSSQVSAQHLRVMALRAVDTFWRPQLPSGSGRGARGRRRPYPARRDLSAITRLGWVNPIGRGYPSAHLSVRCDPTVCRPARRRSFRSRGLRHDGMGQSEHERR